MTFYEITNEEETFLINLDYIDCINITNKTIMYKDRTIYVDEKNLDGLCQYIYELEHYKYEKLKKEAGLKNYYSK